MIKIIDSTLAMIDDYSFSKRQILLFCSYLKEIGIVNLEISKHVYSTMGELPAGFHFYLHLEVFDQKRDYPGIYRYYIINSRNDEKVISEFHMNDIKEIVHLRSKSDLNNIRIVGLDDLLCHNYVHVIEEILKLFKLGNVIFCPEDNYYCATALAVEWLLLGGKEVTTSFASVGGRAATEEVYMAMNIVKRFKPNQSLKTLVEIKELFEEIIHKKVPPCKPIIGSEIFDVESGIHVDGILKNPANYEAYPPEKVGQKTEIILGKYSGSSSIVNKCEKLSLVLPSEVRIFVLLDCIKELSVKNGRSISDEEFLVLYKEGLPYE
jgi:homocitrate synthase NifV